MEKKLTVHLCEGCINNLKEYNPYVDENGNEIPMEELEIKKVSQEKCDNYFGE